MKSSGLANVLVQKLHVQGTHRANTAVFCEANDASGLFHCYVSKNGALGVKSFVLADKA